MFERCFMNHLQNASSFTLCLWINRVFIYLPESYLARNNNTTKDQISFHHESGKATGREAGSFKDWFWSFISQHSLYFCTWFFLVPTDSLMNSVESHLLEPFRINVTSEVLGLFRRLTSKTRRFMNADQRISSAFSEKCTAARVLLRSHSRRMWRSDWLLLCLAFCSRSFFFIFHRSGLFNILPRPRSVIAQSISGSDLSMGGRGKNKVRHNMESDYLGCITADLYA